MWQPFDTHPKDGRDFLAASVTTMDEFDEDDRLIAKGKKVREIYVVYYVPGFDGVMEKTYRGIVRNRAWTHWHPLPALPPVAEMDAAAIEWRTT
jgi:hypothetical protein